MARIGGLFISRRYLWPEKVRVEGACVPNEDNRVPHERTER